MGVKYAGNELQVIFCSGNSLSLTHTQTYMYVLVHVSVHACVGACVWVRVCGAHMRACVRDVSLDNYLRRQCESLPCLISMNDPYVH